MSGVAAPWGLDQWLAYQMQAHPVAIDMGLDRLEALLARIDWHAPRAPVITVAGTNGKGSVTAYCASILKCAGYRVGLFTSPHLRHYRERIRIDDRLATDRELIEAFCIIEAARRVPPEISLTFFEYNALAAFLIFQSAELDAWVLEVGMGGRLDAVNAVDPTVSVIVSIGLDHQEYLGHTLDAIALEKAGILRDYRPAVLGSRDLPQALHDFARQLGARTKSLGREFDFDLVGAGNRWNYSGPRWTLRELPPPALPGAVQYANAATAIAALEELAPVLEVRPDAVAAGLESVRLIGRFQILAPLSGQPEWILDVAHNPDAARVLAQNLAQRPARGRSLAVCAMLADKDAAGVARELRGSFDAWWLASTAGNRGASAVQLEQRLDGQITAPMHAAGDVADACARALADAKAEDRIVVFGSFHAVAPALDWLEAKFPRDPNILVRPFR